MTGWMVRRYFMLCIANLNLRTYFNGRSLYSCLAYGPITALLTWFTLAGELFTGIFIWFQETRNAAIAAGAVMHLGFQLVFEIKQFQWLMLVSLLLFLTPHDWMAMSSIVLGWGHRLR